ncbi:MAG TPA: DUF3891 family protein [Capillimicrobium sp.]|nr:DUF3891 family protein [Capillimicrobium sp.]
MLLRDDAAGEAVIAIGQASHAWISGQLARAWRPRVEPYDEVCLAAEQHDVGMAAWDLAPTLNPDTGRPHSFLEMPLETHLRLWYAAPGRLLSQSRWAALLVSLHGTAIYELRDLARMEARAADDVRAYLAAQRVLQARLAQEVGAEPERLRELQRLLFTWDGLSLALCLRWDPYTVHGVTLREGRWLSPWPFEGDELTVRCEGRRLEGRYEREEALHDALEHAERVELSFTLRPGRDAA